MQGGIAAVGGGKVLLERLAKDHSAVIEWLIWI
jgi:hypothetical protein